MKTSSASWNSASFDNNCGCTITTTDHSQLNDNLSGSSSASGLVAAAEVAVAVVVLAMRPNTLNVSRDKKNTDTKKFIR